MAAKAPARSTRPVSMTERASKLGLIRDWDFVLHLPLRYEDETQITPIARLQTGQTAQVEVTCVSSRVQRGRFNQLIAQVGDSSGTLQVRLLHFFPNQLQQFAAGNRLRLYGEVRSGYMGVLEMVHPRIKPPLNFDQALPNTLTPVYPAGEGLTQTWLRKRIDRALLDVQIHDIVPAAYTSAMHLPGLASSISQLHHPPVGADLQSYDQRTTPAWSRLKYDELVAQQIALKHSRELKAQSRAPALTNRRSEPVLPRFLASLPFTLTGAQQRVWSEIEHNLSSPVPMQRLVQGDVGCGKTVIAALAAVQAIDCGCQVCLMAPTELLAKQHYSKICAWLEPLGIRMAWLAGSLREKTKVQCREQLAQGSVDFVIGTHALIQDSVHFARLALVIVDEQHRFGVSQRLKLRSGDSSQTTPHLLMLSATPIPRTLAMSYLADIDISVIDELPPGRQPVTTKLIQLERTPEIVAALDLVIAQSGQCYWVCPLIEESDSMDLTAAVERAQLLAQWRPNWRIGLVHGAMATDDKQQIMTAFMNGTLDVLVATTVIEVGVDVPNASVMVIEHAERCGLAQLHQLRGRVGRGARQSFCLLLYDARLSDTGKQRLRIIKQSSDGFEIAREDLKLRGPGEFLGARQSGVPLLRFADLQTDTELLERAQQDAQHWLLTDKTNALEHARRWFDGMKDFLEA